MPLTAVFSDLYVLTPRLPPEGHEWKAWAFPSDEAGNGRAASVERKSTANGSGRGFSAPGGRRRGSSPSLRGASPNRRRWTSLVSHGRFSVSTNTCS